MKLAPVVQTVHIASRLMPKIEHTVAPKAYGG